MNTTPLRIALIGRSGAGKTEAASLLQADYGCRVVKTGAICRAISLLLFGNDHKASTQALDDALTSLDPSIFLKAALRDVPPDESVVLDALRFTSDLRLAKAQGFRTIKVVAPEEMRVSRLGVRGQVFDPLKDGRHRSEIELDDSDVDAIIENVGTREELRSQVRAAISRFA